MMTILKSRPLIIINILAVFVRICFFFYGTFQDKHSDLPYTDIDYSIYTDAARNVCKGRSPYEIQTYRYTPLLSWILTPTCFGKNFFSFGKILFMTCDILVGVLISKIIANIEINKKKVSIKKNVILTSLWLFNPLLISLSTRGSSECITILLIMMSLYKLIVKKSYCSSAFYLGFAIHFKIYPIIFLPSIFFSFSKINKESYKSLILGLINKKNTKYITNVILTFSLFFAFFFIINEKNFVTETYLYHFNRIDHRHNFSVYHVLIYYIVSFDRSHFLSFRSLLFIPQFLFTMVLVPLAFARKNLIFCMFLQCLIFVTFNKVVTSQYFLWYASFFPFIGLYLNLDEKKNIIKIILMLVSWGGTQLLWLFFAYQIEFRGKSYFDNGLIFSSILFFLNNCFICCELMKLFYHQSTQKPQSTLQIKKKIN